MPVFSGRRVGVGAQGLAPFTRYVTARRLQAREDQQRAFENERMMAQEERAKEQAKLNQEIGLEQLKRSRETAEEQVRQLKRAEDVRNRTLKLAQKYGFESPEEWAFEVGSRKQKLEELKVVAQFAAEKAKREKAELLDRIIRGEVVPGAAESTSEPQDQVAIPGPSGPPVQSVRPAQPSGTMQVPPRRLPRPANPPQAQVPLPPPKPTTPAAQTQAAPAAPAYRPDESPESIAEVTAMQDLEVEIDDLKSRARRARAIPGGGKVSMVLDTRADALEQKLFLIRDKRLNRLADETKARQDAKKERLAAEEKQGERRERESDRRERRAAEQTRLGYEKQRLAIEGAREERRKDEENVKNMKNSSEGRAKRRQALKNLAVPDDVIDLIDTGNLMVDQAMKRTAKKTEKKDPRKELAILKTLRDERLIDDQEFRASALEVVGLGGLVPSQYVNAPVPPSVERDFNTMIQTPTTIKEFKNLLRDFGKRKDEWVEARTQGSPLPRGSVEEIATEFQRHLGEIIRKMEADEKETKQKNRLATRTVVKTDLPAVQRIFGPILAFVTGANVEYQLTDEAKQHYRAVVKSERRTAPEDRQAFLNFLVRALGRAPGI